MTANRQGAPNQAYQFDGVDDAITLPEVPGFESNSHTLSAWMFIPTQHTNAEILGKDGEDAGERQWVMETKVNGKVIGAIWTTDGIHQLTSNKTLNVGQWTHVVQIWTGTTLSLYLNGVLDSSLVTSGSLSPGSQPVRIGGGAPSGAPFHFTGNLDEIRIYNRPLSEQEISQLHLLEAPPALVTSPTSQSVFPGSNVALAVSATGPDLQYQWLRNGTVIP